MSTQPFLKLFVIVCLLIIWSLPASAQNNIIRVAADSWCPYNCDPNDENRGLLIDLAAQALEISGYKLDYQLMNWARAKQQVISGKLDGIVGMSRTSNSESLYQFSNQPLGKSQVCFFRLASNNWVYTSVDSLTGKHMGWINDFWFANEPKLHDWIKANRNGNKVITLSGSDIHSRLFKLIQRGRIDTFAEDRNVIAYALNEQKLTDKISVAGCTRAQEEVHVAFSLKAADRFKWAKALETGIQTMRLNEQLSAILSKYGLTEETWLQ